MHLRLLLQLVDGDLLNLQFTAVLLLGFLALAPDLSDDALLVRYFLL
jgi:hypothetical protein